MTSSRNLGSFTPGPISALPSSTRGGRRMRESCTYGVVRGRSVMSVPTAIIIVFGEAHLRRVVKSYADYYNVSKTHRSLNKDAPLHRPIERLGAVVSRPVLGGLHHQYCRI